jgi:cytochrome c peroxidase
MHSRTPDRSRVFLLAALLIAAIGCEDDDNGPSAPRGDEFEAIIEQFELAPLQFVPYPRDNEFRAERVALGQLLFFDPILGGESAPWVKAAAGLDPYRHRANDMACATCHFPSLAFADGRCLGAGVAGAQFDDLDLGPSRVVPGRSLITGEEVGTVPRNSPSVLNAACNGLDSPEPVADSFQFMDGRVTGGLEEQAKLPITSRDEMAGDAYGRDVLGDDLTPEAIQDSVTARIRCIPEYVERFQQAFAREISGAGDITIDHIARAIAAFERELITPGSRYDRFVSGERSVFSPIEQEGLRLFFGKALCGNCHRGIMLSDFTFHVQGVGDDYDSVIPGFGGKSGDGRDLGRYHADPDRLADQMYAFRTLTIRNVELTAPYFHSGSAGTLREVVEFHDRGGQGPDDISDEMLASGGATRDPSIRPLDLTSGEIDALVAFMKTTTAPVQPGPLSIDLTGVPSRVPSGLVPPGVPTPPGPGPFMTTGR